MTKYARKHFFNYKRFIYQSWLYNVKKSLNNGVPHICTYYIHPDRTIRLRKHENVRSIPIEKKRNNRDEMLRFMNEFTYITLM